MYFSATCRPAQSLHPNHFFRPSHSKPLSTCPRHPRDSIKQPETAPLPPDPLANPKPACPAASTPSHGNHRPLSTAPLFVCLCPTGHFPLRPPVGGKQARRALLRRWHLRRDLKEGKERAAQITARRAVQAQGTASAKALRSGGVLTGSPWLLDGAKDFKGEKRQWSSGQHSALPSTHRPVLQSKSWGESSH